MILNTAPQDSAVLSNVGEIGEFRIRNSAKAFNILSSGLYANKIRAIIRELSCNAVDSHVAAGCPGTPFDVHLPNQLEPWFAIRDYGVGLDHEQVANIYTTYFESTKTASNEFIGALGLGSKSPFSYTDNFTVTATKNGRRGIYTAFINEQGIPSIALMLEEASSDPAGVEVKFAVNNYNDFGKFQQEARNVYKYFGLRPVITGASGFKFEDQYYDSKDIIPGVHQTTSGGRSTAVMGNIAYDIAVPESDKSLGDLRPLLNCGLEIHFAIGELDFQASREGLSYIPQTVEAIRQKLTNLNAVLVDKLKQEADAIDNLWQRAVFLAGRKNNNLWSAAVLAYGDIATFNAKSYAGLVRLTAKVDEVSQKYNIRISGFQKVSGVMTLSPIKLSTNHGPIKPDGTRDVWNEYQFVVNLDDHFIVSDIKRGAKERTKYHYRNYKSNTHSRNVFILEAVDKDKPMRVNEFFASIHEPPPAQRFMASELNEKPRDSGGNYGKASVLKLVESRRSRHSYVMAWNNAGTVADYDSTKNFYYVEMDHWTPVGIPVKDIKSFYELINRAGVHNETIYGVRRKDIPEVRKLKNWIELGSFVRVKLQATDMNNLMSLVKESIDFKNVFKYTSSKLNQNSPYYKLYAEFKDVESIDSHKRHYIEQLYRSYGIIVANVNPQSLIEDYRNQVDQIKQRYPMLTQLSSYGTDVNVVVDYINMVDQVKGI